MDTPTPPSSLLCIVIIYGLHSSSMREGEREKERERERERETESVAREEREEREGGEGGE